jgi:ubiquinone/menaquinone biosynthesis C-methylase UbiE
MAKLEAAVEAGWLPGKRFVDFGCGTASLTNRLARRCDLSVGLDVSQGMLRQAKKRRRRVELVLADACYPPFRPHAFTSCACFTSFHHFREKSLAISGMIDCVCEGGSLAFSLLVRGKAAHDERMILSNGLLEVTSRSLAGNDTLLVMRRRQAVPEVASSRDQQL